MKNSILVFSALFFFQAVQSGAQSAQPSPKPTPPPGPLIQKRAPDFSQWIIVTNIPANQGEGNSKTPSKTIIVTKTGNIMHTAIVDEQRRTWDIWNETGLHVLVSPDGKDVGHVIQSPDPMTVNPFFFDYSATDFPGFEWISVKYFYDIKPYQGRNCLVFKAGDETVQAAAYIDEDTRLPLVLADSNGIHLYQFQSAPSTMQTLPAGIQEFLVEEQHHIQSVANRPIKPY